MAIKTFNIDSEAYAQYAAYCKKHGISMSRRVEFFIREELVKLKDKLPTVKPSAHTGAKKAEHHSFSKYC
jgi:hypothetical protein